MHTHLRPAHHCFVHCAGIALLLVSCIDDPLATATELSPRLGYVAAVDQRNSDFTLQMSAVGAFKPNEPIRITSILAANQTVSDVTVSLTVLDLPPSNDLTGTSRAATIGTWRGTASTAAQQVLSEEVTFPEPGYYRIVAAAAAPKPHVVSENLDTPFPEGTTQTLWIVVRPEGGWLTTGYQEQAQDSLRLLFGAYGPYRRPIRKAATMQHIGAASASYFADPYYIIGRYRYFDESTDTNYYVNDYVPVGGGRVVATCVGYSSWDIIAPDVEVQVITGVNYDGWFVVECPTEAAYAWDHIEGMIYPRRSGLVDVRNSSGSANGSSFYGWHEDTLISHAASNRQAHVLTVLSERVPVANSAFVRSRSEIQARVWETGSSSNGYLPAADRIEFKASTTMFNAYGPWTVMHEYGHGFHWKAIEEPDTTGGGVCPSGHFPSDSTTLSCALIEGFADVFATLFLADFLTSGSFIHDYNMEINGYWSYGDGSIVEGAVAGFLYDLVDDADTPDTLNGDDDDASYSPETLANILQTCDMPGKSKIDGIDRFVYCAEETLAMQDSINPATSDYWFASRRPTTFSSFTVSSQGLDSLVVRRTWKYNLFNQGTLK